METFHWCAKDTLLSRSDTILTKQDKDTEHPIVFLYQDSLWIRKSRELIQFSQSQWHVYFTPSAVITRSVSLRVSRPPSIFPSVRSLFSTWRQASCLFISAAMTSSDTSAYIWLNKRIPTLNRLTKTSISLYLRIERLLSHPRCRTPVAGTRKIIWYSEIRTWRGTLSFSSNQNKNISIASLSRLLIDRILLKSIRD